MKKTQGKLHQCWQGFLGYNTKSTGNNSKNRQVRLRQTKQLLHNKGNNQPTEWKKICANHLPNKGLKSYNSIAK